MNIAENPKKPEPVKKYTECLNDLMNYFLLADVEHLSAFKLRNGFSNDLISEFTTNSLADLAVKNGVIVPMRGIKNLPYTLYFSPSKSVFTDVESVVQHHAKGYVLHVISGRIYLLTMPLLKDWSEKIDFIEANKPYFDLKNGWYEVEIICGETLQETGWEPTIEYRFKYCEAKPFYDADADYLFRINCREY